MNIPVKMFKAISYVMDLAVVDIPVMSLFCVARGVGVIALLLQPVFVFIES